MTWVERVFFRVGSYSVRHPWRILLVAALAAAGSLWAIATRLELMTSNLDLVDPAQPTVRRFLEFAGRFGTPNLLVIVLEGTDSASLREAVNRVAPGVRRIPEVRQVLDILPLRLDPKSGESRGGYITSEDGRMYFILVQPTDPYSRASSIEPMVRGVRQVMAGSRLEELAVRAGLTGMPEYALHDRDVVRRDITWLSGISFALIAVMFFACFRSVRRPLLAMGVLVLGVVLCLGVVSFYPGHLTLLSASFASILFGLGIDYGIHLISRLEEGVAAGLSDREVLPEAMAAIGRSLLTGCLTTALVLFSLQFSGFRGFAELGFIAGLGVVLCLVVMVTVLPAGLVLFQPRAPAAEWDPPRLGRWLVHLPYRSIGAVLGAAALGGLWVGGPAFDTDYLNLQPADSEAVRLEREMVSRSSLSPQFAAFVVDSEERARVLTTQLAGEEMVGEVHSIVDYDTLRKFGMPIQMMGAGAGAGFKSADGRYAVYAYPEGDVWNPSVQQRFIERMRSYDPEVTGMPILGQYMVDQSRRALWITSGCALLILVLCVYADFRRWRWTALALLPTLLTAAALPAGLKLLGVSFNPLNVVALPVVLGIAVDDGVHLVHRYLRERGDLRATLAGAGRSIVLTSATTVAAFGALAFARHRGLASFGLAIGLGVTLALLLSVLVLPAVLAWVGTPDAAERRG